MKRFWSVIIFFLCLSFQADAKEIRIFVDSYINGQPVKLVFDTGAEGPMLFRQAANRLKLSVTEAPDDIPITPGKMKIAKAETCRFQIIEGGVVSEVHFAVADMPGFLKSDFDGVIGWGGLKHTMIEINPALKKTKIHTSLDFDKSEWKCLEIRTDLNVLVVKTSNNGIECDNLLIDTGSFSGLTIKKQLWPQLVGDKDDANTTLSAIYYPGVGLVVDQEKWAQEVNFSGLQFDDIPVQMGLEAHPWLTKEGIDGVVGMWALSCYTWIVDGPNGKIYFKENDLRRIPEKYEYNRLGAVFVPEDIQTSNALMAHVLKDGPAYAAGIRNGDELLMIGQLDVTKWRTDPAVMPLSRFWTKPAGTKSDLVLMRDEKKIEITVTLEEIFK